jgi:hypothetical protein
MVNSIRIDDDEQASERARGLPASGRVDEP